MGPAGELASMLDFPLLVLLGHFAVYRARRYRLTRTVYRGVRCHQTGSALRYAFCAMFWWVLIVLTLGLAYPFAQASLERFKMRNTYYGDLAGRFEGSGFGLFLRGLPMWFLVMAPLALASSRRLGRSTGPHLQRLVRQSRQLHQRARSPARTSTPRDHRGVAVGERSRSPCCCFRCSRR